MLLIDYNAIAIATIAIQRTEQFEKDIVKHMILNSIRMHAVKHKAKYGLPVICCDHRSWRKEYYPEYKANRRSGDKDEYWEMVFEVIGELREEIQNNFPYKVLHFYGAEADDIIGTLVEHSNDFGHYEDVMIISGDKDFVQLQKYNNVKQYSPVKRKFIEEKHPRTFLMEHILRGDKGDGVPNVLSDDKTFVDNRRQKVVSKKFVQSILDASTPETSTVWNEEVARNYARNKKLIDLSETPEDLKQEIINSYVNQKVAHRTKVMNYLVQNRMKMLIESIADFL